MALTATIVPVVAGAALFAVDHAIVVRESSALQKAADSAAIATARELHFIKMKRDGNEDTLSAVAQGYAARNMPGATLIAEAWSESDTLIGVTLTQTLRSPLGRVFDTEKTLTASAKAEIYAAQNICIIAMDRENATNGNAGNPGIKLEDNARIEAGECGLYSNTTVEASIHTSGSSFIEADFICAAGGHRGGKGHVSTPVTEDCQVIEDPLAKRYFPPAPPCDPSFPTVIGQGQSINLHPGTYCGGLRIAADADVWFEPGLYHFDNGPLVIAEQATAKGENVALIFEDQTSWFEFRDDATISFSAPTTGPSAGIVAVGRMPCPGSRRCPSNRQFLINSANVRSLLGTVYLTLDNLLIDTTMPISEEAAFTILIVDNMQLRQSPVLVLNTDYAATDVPVPAGLTGNASTRLVE